MAHGVRDAAVWALSGALMFGLLAGLGTLFSYSPPILEIDPGSPGRIPLYKACAVYAGTGVLLGLYAYSRSRYFDQVLPPEKAPTIADFFTFAVGIPAALLLLAFVPPDAVHVSSDDVRVIGSLLRRSVIELLVGVVGTSMTVRSARFYVSLLFDR
jgi:hypothetical protein